MPFIGQELHLFQQPLHCVFSVHSNVLAALPEVVLHLGLPTDSWNGFMVYLENIYWVFQLLLPPKTRDLLSRAELMS